MKTETEGELWRSDNREKSWIISSMQHFIYNYVLNMFLQDLFQYKMFLIVSK